MSSYQLYTVLSLNVQNNLDEFDPDDPMLLPPCTSDVIEMSKQNSRTEITGQKLRIILFETINIFSFNVFHHFIEQSKVQLEIKSSEDTCCELQGNYTSIGNI